MQHEAAQRNTNPAVLSNRNSRDVFQAQDAVDTVAYNRAFSHPLEALHFILAGQPPEKRHPRVHRLLVRRVADQPAGVFVRRQYAGGGSTTQRRACYGEKV